MPQEPTQILRDKPPQLVSETPDENGAILVMEIYRSGKTIDGRVILRQEVREIYKNTTQFILSKNVFIPLKFGHFDQDQTAKGEVIGLEIKRKRKKGLLSSELYLIATIKFHEDAYILWKERKLRNVSAEIADEGFDESGNRFGQYLCGLALLGTDPPAIPWLETRYANTGEIYYYSYFKEARMFKRKNTLAKNKKKQYAATDVVPVPIADIEEYISIMQSWIEAAGEAPEGEMPPEEGYDSEVDVEKEAKIKALEEELAALKGKEANEAAFSKLVSEGKVKQTDKDRFFALLKDAKLESVVKFFSQSEPVKTPPMKAEIGKTEVVPQSDEMSEEEEAKFKEYLEFYSNPKQSVRFNSVRPDERKEVIEKTARIAAKSYCKTGGKK